MTLPPGHRPLKGEVLLVEDDSIIALEAEDFLLALGAVRVHIASTVEKALTILATTEISFAFLDADLGLKTSEQVARRLSEIGTPFLFASVQGSGDRVMALFPGALVVQKPFREAEIVDATARAMKTPC